MTTSKVGKARRMALEILGSARDLRTDTPVVYCQINIDDYLRLVGTEFGNFTIQRRRETHKAYQRLKEDIRNGALLPSITLSVKPEVVSEITPLIEGDRAALATALSSPGRADILDGLQRTYIMSDLSEEGHQFDPRQTVLVEFWIESDIQKLIYRIIVLNAGQKPMSIRHQLELLFMSLKTSIENEITDLQIYTERDQTRRRRSRKFPLNFVVSGYQAFIQGSSELQKENLIANKMQIESALDSTEEEISDQFKSFIRYLDIYATLDDHMYRVYEGPPGTDLTDPIEVFESSSSVASSRNVHWLSTENVFIAFFAAIAQFSKSETEENSALKLARLNEALQRLTQKLEGAPAGSDPLDIDVFDRLRLGANPRRVNVGTATRRLLVNGFKEFFRAEGDITLAQAWQLAAE